ncbi:MAG: hypothetical protein L0I76_06145 [Pseudonocardia sp.]|nr:hypothetical protein [Pseudonocardia sp.]
MTPTFESGSGPARNGSTPKLPTRTPGSALRRNGTTRTTDTDKSPTGQEASVNGSAPGGITGAQAFAPAGSPSTPDDGADMFTPSVPEQDGSGAHPAVRDPAVREGGPDGPDGFGTGSGTGERPAATPDRQTGTGGEENHASGSGHEVDETTGERTEEHESRRPLFGAAAAAAAVGGVVAAAVGRRRDHHDVPADGRDDDEQDGATSRTPADDDRDATVQTADRDGSGTPDPDEPAAERTDPDASRAATALDAPAKQGLPVRKVPGAEQDPAEQKPAEQEPAEQQSTEQAAHASQGDEEVTDHTPDVRESATTEPADPADRQPAAQADADRPGDDTATPARGLPTTGQPDASRSVPGSSPEAVGSSPEAVGSSPEAVGSSPEAADSSPEAADSSPEAVDDIDSDTTALPVTRPAAATRQPMGGAGPGRDDLPVRRPAPSGRPVMPGGPAGPQRRPQGSPVSSANAGPAARNPVPQNQAAQNQAWRNPASQPAARPPDSLFAPAVPVKGDRGQLRRPGGIETARAGGGQDMSQTTPIFEEIASAWFRSNRSVPVRWQDGGPGGGNGEGGSDGPSRPSPEPRPAAPAGNSGAQAQAGPALDDAEFASPADDLWRQASAGSDEPDRSDEQTSAGLPKRRPRARLLPGSAAGSTVLSPPTSETRSAENVRGRLTSYQQGVRQGREGRRTSPAGTGTTEPSGDRSNTSDHEENT